MILPLFVVLLFQLAGEMLAHLSPLPVPGPVIGMVLLAFGLSAAPRLLLLLRPLSRTILGHLSLLFVPAGVGIVGHADLLRSEGLVVALAIAVSTLLSMAAAALAFQWVARRTGGEDA